MSSAVRGLQAFFTPEKPGPHSYVHGSKIALVGTIVGISLVPDAVFLWLLLPHQLWWVAVILDIADVWAFVWLWGIYGTMVRTPHELTDARIVFHNGIVQSVELGANSIVSARAIGVIRRRDVPRASGKDAAFLSFGGVPLVEVEFDTPVFETRMFGRTRRRIGRAFIASDAPEELCAELRARLHDPTAPVPSGVSGSR